MEKSDKYEINRRIMEGCEGRTFMLKKPRTKLDYENIILFHVDGSNKTKGL